MKKLKIRILSWLLHHANRLGKNERFYLIKNKLLSKYGTHIQYDIQFIDGKQCFACGGTGRYYNYNNEDYEDCFSCTSGWYKRPVWNILAKIQFGKYQFHQPYKRAYQRPDIQIPLIEGYITHNKSKCSKLALTMLLLLYDKTYLKRMWKSKTCKFFNEIAYLKKNFENKIKGVDDDLPF